MNRASYIVSALVIIGLAFVTNRFVYSMFTAMAAAEDNTFSTAAIFPTPTPSGSPSPSSSPNPSGSPVPSASPLPPANHILITEVFPGVVGNSNNGNGGGNVNIQGNGAGSNNQVNQNTSTNCTVNQSNNTNANHNVNSNANSGNNSNNGNTATSSGTVTSGPANSGVTTVVVGGSNNSNGCSGGVAQTTDWVELYNPTAQAVNLFGFALVDNSMIPNFLLGNVTLNPGQFAVIAKDSSTLQALNLPAGVLKINLGTPLGDGVQGAGDRLQLKNLAQIIVDQVSWGSDTSIFTIGAIPSGHSLGRNQINGDSDTASDFGDKSVPNPGS